MKTRNSKLSKTLFGKGTGMLPGIKVYARKETLPRGVTTGITKVCMLEGCSGARIGVRWPDGKITWPCSKGMTTSNTRLYIT